MSDSPIIEHYKNIIESIYCGHMICHCMRWELLYSVSPYVSTYKQYLLQSVIDLDLRSINYNTDFILRSMI
jgi:hypothetical protein